MVKFERKGKLHLPMQSMNSMLLFETSKTVICWLFLFYLFVSIIFIFKVLFWKTSLPVFLHSLLAVFMNPMHHTIGLTQDRSTPLVVRFAPLLSRYIPAIQVGFRTTEKHLPPGRIRPDCSKSLKLVSVQKWTFWTSMAKQTKKSRK